MAVKIKTSCGGGGGGGQGRLFADLLYFKTRMLNPTAPGGGEACDGLEG
jgi:hypothetical protein